MDVRILELLASRICHDIISPVGAINNGVEFMEETGPEGAGDALELIKFSAEQASAKLKAFRMAYGAGGADPNLKPEDVQRTFSGLVSADGKISQTWDPYGPLGPKIPPKGFCKMLICALMLAQECLPKGGTVAARAGTEPGQTLIVAEGPGSGPREGVADALSGAASVETLEPKLAHPYVFGVMARGYGFSVSFSEIAEGRTVISLISPAA